MNERIREIAKQCEHTTQHSYAVGDGTFEVHHFDKEKFAELIVRECAEMMPQDNLYKMVLKRFGVE